MVRVEPASCLAGQWRKAVGQLKEMGPHGSSWILSLGSIPEHRFLGAREFSEVIATGFQGTMWLRWHRG